MEVRRNAWGTIIILKNSEEESKRYDCQKSLSIQNIDYKYNLNQMYELFYNVIQATKKIDFKELNKILKDLQNGDN